mgnify:CR=1 FL=1
MNECLMKIAGTLLDINIVKMDNSKEVCVIKVKQSKSAIFCLNKKFDPNECFSLGKWQKQKNCRSVKHLAILINISKNS